MPQGQPAPGRRAAQPGVQHSWLPLFCEQSDAPMRWACPAEPGSQWERVALHAQPPLPQHWTAGALAGALAGPSGGGFGRRGWLSVGSGRSRLTRATGLAWSRALAAECVLRCLHPLTELGSHLTIVPEVVAEPGVLANAALEVQLVRLSLSPNLKRPLQPPRETPAVL